MTRRVLSRPSLWFALAALVGALAAQVLPAHWLLVPPPEPERVDGSSSVRYACPMFCAILDELPDNGDCPVCGMTLAPVGSSPELDRHEQWSTGLRGAVLTKLPLVHELRLFGEVAYDEGQLSVVTARAQGWLEQLSAKVTWTEVEAREPLFELYAPEIFQALQELRVAGPRGGDLLEAARERLTLLGVDPSEVDLEALASASPRTVTYRAPRAGTLVRRRAVEGAFARMGEELFAIADLSRVWVEFEAFEQDVAWLRLGARLKLRDELRPAEAFDGEITFLDPVIDRASRTRRVRVAVENTRLADGTWSLLPGARMQARAAVPVGADGGPALGSATASRDAEDVIRVLAIPRSALLRTGERDVVYVLHEEREVDGVAEREYRLDPARLPARVGYELVEVRVGPVARRADQESVEWFHPLVRVLPSSDSLALRSLRPGHVVALDGALLLDSQAQLAGRRSLLFPEGREASPDDPHAGH